MIDPSSIELHQFLTAWYGPPLNQGVAISREYLDLPEPLQGWHALEARWPQPLVRNKKLLTPGEMAISGGKVVFMTDPGDALWGFDPISPETVYEGRLYGDWKRLTENLTEFLVHNAINEAASNAPHTKSCESVKNEHIPQIIAPLTEVDFGEWYWPRPGHRLFMSEKVIADVGPAMEDHEPWGDKPGYSEVQVGAVNASALTYLEDVPDTEWY
jgi:hypothetical protein